MTLRTTAPPTRAQASRLLTAAVLLGALSLAAGAEQAPEAPPAASQAQPGAPVAPATPPKVPAVKPSEAPASHGLVGLIVFSSDGTRVGEVRSVDARPDGDIVALHVRTGGFLGFGGRIVAIPQGKFIRSGQSVRIDLDADEVTALPEVKD